MTKHIIYSASSLLSFYLFFSVFPILSSVSSQAPSYTCSIDNKQVAKLAPEYFGLHIGLESIPTDAKARKDLFTKIKQAGFHSIRTQLQWTVVERPIGTYNWQSFDEIYKDIEASGLRASLILIRFPKGMWTADGKEILDPKHYARWNQFVKAAVERYSVRIGNTAKIATSWEVWNEPELSYDGSPESLVVLLNQAYTVIKQTDPQAKIMAPALSTSGLNAIYKIGGTSRAANFYNTLIKNGKFDIMNIHLYQKVDGVNGSVDYIQKVKQELQKNGNSTNRQSTLAVTETGESHWTCQIFNGRSDSKQSELITNRFACLANAGVNTVYHYMAFDQQNKPDNPCPDGKKLRSGIFNDDLTPRRQYYAIQSMIQTLTGTATQSNTYNVADLNKDTKVNEEDFVIIKSDFNVLSSPTWTTSDINKNGKIDIFDYSLFVENYNK